MLTCPSSPRSPPALHPKAGSSSYSALTGVVYVVRVAVLVVLRVVRVAAGED